MDQSTLNLFVGGFVLIAFVVIVVLVFLQTRQLSAVTATIKTIADNPTMIAAVKGATENIPQDVFIKALSVVTTAQALAPTADQKALLEQILTLIKKVDNDASNDPLAAALDAKG